MDIPVRRSQKKKRRSTNESMHPYLAASCPEIVRIEDDGQTWVWRNNDATAAFAPQLAEILEMTSKLLGGLPTITTVLFVASALRRWESDAVWADRLRILFLQELDDTTESAHSRITSLVTWFNQLGTQKENLRKGTTAIASVLGCGLSGRNHLLEITDSQTISEIIRLLRMPSEDREPSNSVYLLSDQEFRSHCLLTVRTLIHLSDRVGDAKTLETWVRTGLRDIPEAQDLQEDLPAATLIETLASLENDHEYGGLIRSSRALSGLVSLPRRPTDPEDLPLGGVSDISNKGDPERLLISELAADPMVLLARIANGQALYMRRESPPGPQASTRPVLIESSIQCWGTARVLMSVLALAVVSSEQRRSKIAATLYRLTSNNYQTIDGSHRAGVVSLIEGLDTSEHPGKGLRRFIDAFVERKDEVENSAEPLLVVTASTLRNPDFREDLLAVKQPILIAGVERDGTTKIVRRTIAGEETVQSFKIALEIEDASPTTLASDGLPLFVSQPQPPLAFCPLSRESDWIPCEDAAGNATAWLLTQDRRLLRFTDSLHGGEEVFDKLPNGNLAIYSATSEQVEFILSASSKGHYWIQYDHETKETNVTRLNVESDNASFALVGAFILCFVNSRCHVFSRSNGDKITEYDTKRRHLNLAYQVDEDGAIWLHGGGAPHDWHRLSKPIMENNRKIGGVIYNADRVWAVSDDLCKMVEIATEKPLPEKERITLLPLNPQVPVQNIRPIAASYDSNRWIIEAEWMRSGGLRQDNNDRFYCHLDLESNSIHRVHTFRGSEVTRQLYPKAYRKVRLKPLRRRASAVAVTRDGIVFEREKGVWFKLSLASNLPRRLTVARCDVEASLSLSQFGDEFKTSNSEYQRWTLRSAKLGGGVCWADSRGLFHFKRNDHPSELTLAFADSHVAGWFSESGTFGPQYYFPVSFEDCDEVHLPHNVASWLMQWFQKSN